MNSSNRFDLPEVFPVEDIIDESTRTRTLVFSLPRNVIRTIKTGQYFMLWLPGFDEKPFSVSKVVEDKIYFTICPVGYTTEALVKRSKGDLIGLRGPYGKGFTIDHGKEVALIIGGGMGMAPLRFLIDSLLKETNNKRIILIHGAKTADELYFKSEIDTGVIEVHYCTDDGSAGFRNYPTQIMERILQENNLTARNLFIYSCGPEIMLKKVLEISSAHGYECSTEISLADRHVRCGFGICGSCYLDDSGLSLCKDGPVFRGNMLLKTSDFGEYGRNIDGTKFRL